MNNPVIKRRTFIKKSLKSLIGIGVLSGLYAWQIEPFWLEFVKVKMSIKNLPNNLIGKTLMQISDIHVGKNFDYHFIIKSFKKAQELNPDFVVYTGDFITSDKDEVHYDYLNEVLQNSVKGKLGTIGILGNHDYGRNWSQQHVADKISDMLTNNGIKLLQNEQVNINGLNFIGFDDYWGLNFNPIEAMKSHDKG